MKEIQKMIKLVHERPVLWDKTVETYKGRKQTRNAWIQVCKELRNGYENMNDKEKLEFEKSIKKRWANIRDSFQRSERMCKSSSRSGTESNPHKTYIYSQQLQFLKKTTADSPSTNLCKKSESDSERTLDEEDLQDVSELAEVEGPRFETPEPKRRKPDQVELELISALNRKPDRHTSFFNGIIPSLEMFDDDEVVEFQLKVMQILSEIKKRKKLGQQ